MTALAFYEYVFSSAGIVLASGALLSIAAAGWAVGAYVLARTLGKFSRKAKASAA